jgi:hypothetical protein
VTFPTKQLQATKASKVERLYPYPTRCRLFLDPLYFDFCLFQYIYFLMARQKTRGLTYSLAGLTLAFTCYALITRNHLNADTITSTIISNDQGAPACLFLLFYFPLILSSIFDKGLLRSAHREACGATTHTPHDK